MRVGVDLDGCGYDLTGIMRSYLIDVRGYDPASLPWPTIYDYWSEWGMTRERWFELLADGIASGEILRHGEPEKGFCEALAELRLEGHSVHIVTFRNYAPMAMENTVAWLAEHDVPHDTMTFAKDKTTVPVDVFIEDSIENARALAASGTPTVLFAQAWNETDEFPRIGSWSDFPEACRNAATKPAGTNPKDLIGLKKPPLRLVPASALIYMSRVMALGASKYGPYNWRTSKVRRTIYLEAAMRHILSALDGEDVDPESGVPHEAHAASCMAIVLDALATGNLVDDRPTVGAAARLIAELTEA